MLLLLLNTYTLLENSSKRNEDGYFRPSIMSREYRTSVLAANIGTLQGFIFYSG